MGEIFLKILNMSIAASWLILAVVLFRFVLKKAPKWIAVLLWGIVALRLMVPFSFESALSLIPSIKTPNTYDIQYETPVISSEISAVNNAVNPVLGETFGPNPDVSVNPSYIWTFIVSVIWCVGIAVMLLYAVICYVRVRQSVAERVPYERNIFLCDHVKSPFILGLVRPKIYLPSNMDTMVIEPVIAHEKAHLARCDHWWKPMGFLILALHWFNPMCWAAYMLLCRDIELACDEKVIRQMDLNGKKNYSAALLECSAGRRLVTICPLAFGEVGVKERVKNVLNYKKPAFWVIVAAVIACAVVIVCFATTPISAENYIRLQSTHSTPPAAFFSLNFAEEEMQGTVIAECWANGRCVSTNPVSINNLTQQIQLYLNPQENGVNVQLGVDNGSTISENFSYPEGEQPVGWSFVSLQEGKKESLQLGEDRIIAAMAFDFGTGIKSYSCDTLSADKKQMENAAYIIVIRAFFADNSDFITAEPNTPKERPTLIMNGDAYVEAHRNDVPKIVEPKPDSGETAPEEPGFSALSSEQTAIQKSILGHNRSPETPIDILSCCSFVTLDTVSENPKTDSDVQRTTYYGWALYQEYKIADNGLETVSGNHTPVALTFEYDDYGYSLLEYWTPRDGSYFAKDIREKFPAHIAEDGINSQKFILQQTQECYAQAVVSAELDTNQVIGALVETICSSPAQSSNPGDYIREHFIEYRELTYYGRYTLEYGFAQFEKGGETGLAGQIMAQVCGDIAVGWGEEPLVFNLFNNGVLTGQMWYSAFRNNALSLMEQYGETELMECYPASYILLRMLGKV